MLEKPNPKVAKERDTQVNRVLQVHLRKSDSHLTQNQIWRFALCTAPPNAVQSIGLLCKLHGIPLGDCMNMNVTWKPNDSHSRSKNSRRPYFQLRARKSWKKPDVFKDREKIFGKSDLSRFLSSSGWLLEGHGFGKRAFDWTRYFFKLADKAANREGGSNKPHFCPQRTPTGKISRDLQ